LLWTDAFISVSRSPGEAGLSLVPPTVRRRQRQCLGIQTPTNRILPPSHFRLIIPPSVFLIPYSQFIGDTTAAASNTAEPAVATGGREGTILEACIETERRRHDQWSAAGGKFERHEVVSPGSGVGTGMQICVADPTIDGRSDIVVAGKTETWLLANERKQTGNE
jgi:hypothetical protein